MTPRFFARGSGSGTKPGSIARSPASRTSTPRTGRSRADRAGRGGGARPATAPCPAKWPPSAVGTPTTAIGERHGPERYVGARPASWADADRRTSTWSASSPAGSSPSGTCCAPRTSRAGRWPSCSRSPTTRPARCGTACGSATRSRPATRCSGARSRRCTRRSSPTTSCLRGAPRRRSSASSTSLLGPGDHAIVTWPGYQSLYEVARAAGAEVTLHELREDDGWALDLERLRRAASGRRRSSSSSTCRTTRRACCPTAADLGPPDRRDRGRAASTSCPTRSTAASSSTRRTGCRRARTPAARGISLGVMSKSFAMAGLRIGWLATRDRALLDRAARYKDYTTICSSAPSEILAIIGLRARDRVLERSRGSSRRTSPTWTGSSPLGGRVRVGPAARRLDRLPEAPRRRRRSTASRRARRGRGRPARCRASCSATPANHFRLGFGRRTCPRRSGGWRRSPGRRLRGR